MNLKEFTSMVDISSVRTDVTKDEIDLMIDLARKYSVKAVFSMPAYTKYVAKALKDTDVLIGGVVGFPSGADLTSTKVETTKKLLDIGCDELDMVINVCALKSGDYDLVYEDVKAVVDAAKDTPVKTILEIPYLNREEIAKAIELCIKAGVSYIKTGTGWNPKPTEVNDIRFIAEKVNGRAKIKAAGGVRTIEIMDQMVDLGCERFGIGIRSTISLLEELYSQEGKTFELKDVETSKHDIY